jgi:peptide/nickel transport system substrate-binding protein
MPGGRLFSAALIAAVVVTTWPSFLSAQFPYFWTTPRREVRIGVTGLPPTVDPVAALEGASPLVARQVFDTLVAYREGSTDVEPALATRWSVSRDGLVWTFFLREGVRFHDGAPLTAADVAASFDRHFRPDPQTGTVGAVWWPLLRGVPGVVKEVRTPDARTVEIVLVQPYAPLLTVLAHPGLSVVRAGFAPDGAERLDGTGPYRVVEAVPGRITLEAAGGWGEAPRNPRLVFLEIAGDDQAEAAIDRGTLDIWFPARPPRRTDGALSTTGLHVGYLAFQTEKEPFLRPPIRQALAAAVDPAALGAALGREAVPLPSFLPPGVWARREGWSVLGGTRQTVATLLAEGGWPADYTPTVLVPNEPGPVDLPGVAAAVKAMLGAVDIPVELRLESAAAVRAAREAGEHNTVLAEAAVLGGDPHLFLYPLSTSEGASKGPRTLNFSFYRNPRLDDVLIRASQLGFRPERERLYHRAQTILAREVPWIPLYVRVMWAVARREVRGLRLHPSGFHRLAPVSLDAPGSGGLP